MKHNPFIETLTLPENVDLVHPIISLGESPLDDSTDMYHGSPFSPHEMSYVFERNGYSEGTWAIIPTQPYHLAEESLAEEPFGEGPSVSAGLMGDAYSRAFLNRHADHFIGVDRSAGFSSAGVLNSLERPVTVVPRAIADRLVAHRPDGYIYQIDAARDGFSQSVFERREDALRDQREHRSARVVQPVGVYAVSFAQYVEARPTVVVDADFTAVKQAERQIADWRQVEYVPVQDAGSLVEHFGRIGIQARLLSEM